MKELLGVLVPIPVAIGVLVGTLRSLMGAYPYANAVAMVLSLAIFFGVWFPFVLVPYLKKKSRA